MQHPEPDSQSQRAIIAGVDEVGRGPLAGPVVAAAVILDPNNVPSGITDSKRLTASRREKLAPAIKSAALAWAVAAASVTEIDTKNIRVATHLAMQRAVAGLGLIPSEVRVDGNDAPSFVSATGPVSTQSIVGGDLSDRSIGAASILAKVARDRDMARLDSLYPGYEFAKNKGYGTAVHRRQLRALGPTPEHRRSFAPLRLWVEEGVFA